MVRLGDEIMRKQTGSNAVIMTGSEARAEACYIVIEIIMKRLADSERKRIQAEAYLAAADCGIESIRTEVECLFP